MQRSAAPEPARPAAAQRRSEAALEQDADRRAVLALGAGPAPALALGTPGAPRRAAAGGQALPPALRRHFEPRFGADFGQVRIHDDAAAHALARAARAQASALGHDIHFGAGRWQPQTHAGLALLAHELAHVAQANEGAPVGWRNKPDAAAAPVARWYQQAIDQVAAARREMAELAKSGGPVIVPSFFDTQVALLELCEAVEAGDRSTAPKKLDALLKAGFGIGQGQFSRELLLELSARLYELGLEADAARLRDAYAAFEKIGPHDPDIYGQRRRLDFLARLIQGADAPGLGSAEAAGASLRRYARAYAAVRATWRAIDFDAVETERRLGLGGFALRPMLTRAEFHDRVFDLIEDWHRAWSAFMQRAIDGARADLEKAQPDGRGAALLGALRREMVGALQPAINLDVGQPHAVFAQSFKITQTELPRPGEGRVVDVFDQAAGQAKPKSVPVTTYDPRQEAVPELRSSIVNSYDTRLAQIHQLGRLYGALDALTPRKAFVDTLAQAEAAVDTRQSAQAAGGLKLDNDDSWRVFLLQKYRDLTDTSAAAAERRVRPAMAPADALKEIVSLLFGYFRAFTVHARYTNLYDIGTTPYFNRPFPRALTGQLVHDCGVYAMRAAYVLSLVRRELKLRFHFVRLPAHVSLVINGDAGNALPTFVIENDSYAVFDATYLARRRKSWQAFQDPSTDQAPPGPADDRQFIGELAAAQYIGGPLDMPVRVTEVPRAVADAKAEQRQLWAYYQGSAMADVFGPATQDKASPNHLFHTQYLALTEQWREIHNREMLDFWNDTGPAAWAAFERALEGRTDPQAAARTEVDVATLKTLLERYHLAFTTALQPLFDRVFDYREVERKLGERLRADPRLAKAGVRYSAGLRAATLFRLSWEWYEDDLVDYEVALDGRDPKDKESVADAKDSTRPPWVPAPDHSLNPLD